MSHEKIPSSADMPFENILVTVGTTEFDKLVNACLQDDTIKALKSASCKNIKIQYGAGKVIPSLNDPEISLECYRYKDSILDDIRQADLIISHAGAGSCMDVLERKKPLITVINDELMHNHQRELAEKLNEECYSLFCTPDNLVSTINEAKKFNFKTFTYNYDYKCALFIEKLMCSTKVS